MSIPWKPGEIDTLRTLAWRGLSVAEIASRLGRSASSVRGERARQRIHTDGRPGPRPRGDAIVVHPWASMTLQQQTCMRRRLNIQIARDEPVAIDAMLRLPAAERELEDCVAQLEQAAVKHLSNLARIAALEAKLARIAELVGEMWQEAQSGSGYIGVAVMRIEEYDALRATLAPEVTHGY